MKRIGIVFLITGIVLLFGSLEFTFSGAVIGTGVSIKNSLLFILSLSCLMVSFIMLVAEKSLEAIVIPTGGETNESRTRGAMTLYKSRKEKPYVLISGEIERDSNKIPKKESQQYEIYKELRKEYGLRPSDIIVEGKSKDTLENFLFMLKKLKKKGINRLEISTNPTQYWRFKLFERQARSEGLIDESFEMEPVYNRESPKQFLYGLLAYAKDYLRVKSSDSLEEARKKKIGSLGEYFKRLLWSDEKK
jgi:uncharacterized SAM-binding protein YcdF (DUF218 family)